ncbi:hypothetical protein [Microvirga lotononidis]|uniref:Uncharacterized protein n=1 Tax=Microvirga lotononidis TaxID=864069 RepID=I4YX48_9HYPH|nr:hypothetical protein [Microvirga lotononidis]EIM28540.1 hypothetical protein MicloDRAFT_00051260 [Microvirga lotononidis]WQO27390.1 hypothetical protein U0023_22575 [Microvirga lotononidis]
MVHRLILLGSVFLPLMIQQSQAGPCTQEIDGAQAQVDARIDSAAGAGRAGPESTAALLRRQPTPASIAAAEQKLGEGKPEEAALAALARARAADAAGDRAGCDEALAMVRKALAH